MNDVANGGRKHLTKRVKLVWRCHAHPSCASEGWRESIIRHDDGWKAKSSLSSSPATIRKRSAAMNKMLQFPPKQEQQIFLSAVEKWDNDNANNRWKGQY
jgi:hypothetical protein